MVFSAIDLLLVESPALPEGPVIEGAVVSEYVIVTFLDVDIATVQVREVPEHAPPHVPVYPELGVEVKVILLFNE